MHFALLVSQLPHVEDARAEYGELLASGQQSHRVRDAAIAIWSAVSKLLSKSHA
jgi:hypothetical protein